MDLDEEEGENVEGRLEATLTDGLYTKEESFRIEALHHASRVHEGCGSSSVAVLGAAENFERYLKTGR